MKSKISVAVIVLFAALSISNSFPILRDESQQNDREYRQLISTGSSDITAVTGPLTSGAQKISTQPLPGNGFGNSVKGPGPITARNPPATRAPSPAKQNSKGSSPNQGNKNQGKDKNKESTSSEEDSNEDGDSNEEGPQTFGSYEDEDSDEE